jgi:hypothetical protein
MRRKLHNLPPITHVYGSSVDRIICRHEILAFLKDEEEREKKITSHENGARLRLPVRLHSRPFQLKCLCEKLYGSLDAVRNAVDLKGFELLRIAELSATSIAASQGRFTHKHQR